MKGRRFSWKIWNLALIIAALISYNGILHARSQAEEIGRLNAKVESLGLENAALRESVQSSAPSEEQADAQAKGIFKDGAYEGEAEGFGGKICICVQIKDGKITDIEILSAEQEDETYLAMAEEILDKILKQQSVDVDCISGATFSSTGIKNAVAEALEKAVK